jgi:DNA polymerase-3 subunit gamma/tau
MASQALYRKWRSQTFGQLVGQEHVVQTLQNAIAEERVAHAYLFTGPRGVGKTSMARLLAKAVNCTAPPPQRPCGICESCQIIAAGRSVDIIEMDAASHTSVEDAREIIERVQFRPTSGQYKVYVIDEVHMLSTAAFNALLKTLEEPPEHAIFILATTEVHKVPATILSRCQRFTFTRHTIAATATHLQHIAAEEHITLEPGVAEAIARAATGSMRDALGVLEQLASFAGDTITLEQVQNLLGMSSAAEVSTLIDALIQNDVRTALQSVNAVADQGVDMRQFARDLIERLRALMLLMATGDRSLLDVGDDELSALEAWSQRADIGLVQHWIKLLSNLDYQLRTSSYGHLPLELALVEGIVSASRSAAPSLPSVAPAARSSPSPEHQPAPSAKRTPPPAPPAAPPPAAVDASAKLPQPATQASTPAAHKAKDDTPITEYRQHEDSSEQVSPSPSPPPSPAVEEEKAAAAEPPPPPPPPPQERQQPPVVAEATETAPVVAEEEDEDEDEEVTLLEQVQDRWPDIVYDVRPRDPKLQAILKGVQPVNVEGNTIVLQAMSKFHKTNLERARSRQIVEEIVGKHMGASFSIRCVIESQQPQQDIRVQKRAARKDPLVRAAMNIFDADIIDIEQTENSEHKHKEE